MPAKKIILDLSYLPCMEKFPQMMQCFYDKATQEINKKKILN